MTKQIRLENGKYKLLVFDDGTIEYSKDEQRWRKVTGNKLASMFMQKITLEIDNLHNVIKVLEKKVSK